MNRSRARSQCLLADRLRRRTIRSGTRQSVGVRVLQPHRGGTFARRGDVDAAALREALRPAQARRSRLAVGRTIRRRSRSAASPRPSRCGSRATVPAASATPLARSPAALVVAPSVSPAPLTPALTPPPTLEIDWSMKRPIAPITSGGVGRAGAGCGRRPAVRVSGVTLGRRRGILGLREARAGKQRCGRESAARSRTRNGWSGTCLPCRQANGPGPDMDQALRAGRGENEEAAAALLQSSGLEVFHHEKQHDNDSRSRPRPATRAASR